MIKKGDYVTRKKYNHDILFKVIDVKNNIVILKGVDLRLYADSNYDDLVLATISKKKDDLNTIRKLNNNDYFYIPGVIVHLDSDKDYLEKCIEYYRKQKIKFYGYIFNESEYKDYINKIIKKHNPNIIVITGHDSYSKKYNKYRNSEYFIETVREIRKNYKNIIVIAGACQSDFINLIKAGSTYASSPGKVNIHALDPAIIASYLALTKSTETINLIDILSKTKYGSDGIGGIKTFGTMLECYPRKEK